MTGDRLLRISIVLLIAASPLLLWLVLYLANPRSQDELRTQISRMRQLRWISYIAGIAIWIFCFVDHRFSPYWNFGTGVIGASVGLEIPAAWLKKRLARSEEPEGSFPNAARLMD
jgi:hypothetical protein